MITTPGSGCYYPLAWISAQKSGTLSSITLYTSHCMLALLSGPGLLYPLPSTSSQPLPPLLRISHSHFILLHLSFGWTMATTSLTKAPSAALASHDELTHHLRGGQFPALFSVSSYFNPPRLSPAFPT